MDAQKVLVTAGAVGIGREIVRCFAARRVQISFIDIAAENLATLKQELPDIQTALCDVSRRADFEQVIPKATDGWMSC